MISIIIRTVAGDCHGFYGEKHRMWYAMTNKGKVEIMAGGCIFDMDGLLFDTERIFKITGEPSRRSGGLFLRTVSLQKSQGRAEK